IQFTCWAGAAHPGGVGAVPPGPVPLPEGGCGDAGPGHGLGEGAGGAELDQTGAGGFGEGCGLSGVLATDAVVLLHQQQQRGLRQAHGVPGGHGPVVGDGGALAAQCGVQEPRGQGCAVLGGVLPEGGGGVQQVEGVLVVSEPVGDLVAVLFGEPLRVVLGGGGSQGGVGDSQQQPVCCGV